MLMKSLVLKFPTVFCLMFFIAAYDGRALDKGTGELGFWVGYSPDNPTLIGKKTDRPFFELNIQYARTLATGRDWAIKHTIELVPVAIISQPEQAGVASGGRPANADVPNSRRAIYGGGISPIGLQLNYRRGRMIQPYVNGTAGLIYFTDQVPVKRSSQFNFAVGWGAGVQIWHGQNRSTSFGYRFRHISNANSSNVNPGVDSNLIYAGYNWGWRRQ